MGPYTYKNELAGSNLDPGGWLIDASVLQYNNNLYLVGSGFIGGSAQSLVIAPMSNPYTLAATTFTVISSPTYDWERNSDGTPNFGTPVALGATLPGTSGETAATPTAYNLVNRHSGKCLDVSQGNTAHGTDVIQWTCNGGANQKWTFSDPGNETNRLTNVATGKVLDVNNCGTADGTNIQQWSWLNSNCQKWRLVYTLTDYVRLVNVNSGKGADVANCGTADGADVRQWTWLNNDCQLWQLKPVS